MNIHDLLEMATRNSTLTLNVCDLVLTLQTASARHDRLFQENVELRRRVDELERHNDELSRELSKRK